MYRLLLLAIFCGSALATSPGSLPPSFKKCSRSSPGFQSCLTPAVQGAFPDLVKGLKNLGVSSIDPMVLTALKISQGGGSPVSIDLDFNNPSIIGISKLTIDSVTSELNGNVKKLTIKASTKSNVILKGRYKINGKVLVLPISGNGDSEINLTGAEATIAFTGKTVTKDGETYLVFNSCQFLLNPTKVIFYFQNLFNGDKALGDNMNKFLNDNWEVVYKELKEAIEKAFAATFLGITNRIFTKVPYNGIFPE